MYFGGIMIFVIFAVSLINSYLATFLPPQTVQQIGGGLMLFLMVGCIIGLEAYYILHTSAYPHIQMLIRPNNELVELYVENMQQLLVKKVGDNLFSSTFNLQFPRRIKAYGNAKINQIKILHEYEPGQRFNFQPGRASLDEYTFNHPQTEFIEVVQTHGKSTSIERSEAIPEYKLLAARNDWRRTFVSPYQLSSTIHGNRSIAYTEVGGSVELEDLRGKLKEANEKLAQSKSNEEKWHQDSISKNEWADHLSTETRGLLDAKGGIPLYATEYVLTLLSAMHDLDQVAKYLQGSPFDRWGKWVIIGLIAGGALIYLQLNPQIMQGIYQFFSTPTNQITILAVLAVALGAVYLILRRRKG
jgi:hypothetical protein